jgi:hypothetical protein
MKTEAITKRKCIKNFNKENLREEIILGVTGMYGRIISNSIQNLDNELFWFSLRINEKEIISASVV